MIAGADRTRDAPEMRICALIPAFNEAPHIAAVVRGAGKHVREVVLVDDGSSDSTADIAAAAGAVCLRSNRNHGKATALRTGLAHVWEREFTHVLFLDGDGQHCPDDIPSLIRVAGETNADLVIGTRSFDIERIGACQAL